MIQMQVENLSRIHLLVLLHIRTACVCILHIIQHHYLHFLLTLAKITHYVTGSWNEMLIDDIQWSLVYCLWYLRILSFAWRDGGGCSMVSHDTSVFCLVRSEHTRLRIMMALIQVAPTIFGTSLLWYGGTQI